MFFLNCRKTFNCKYLVLRYLNLGPVTYQNVNKPPTTIELQVSKDGTTNLDIPSAIPKTTELEKVTTISSAAKEATILKDVPISENFQMGLTKEKEKNLINDVPGPKILQTIANVLSFIPIFGNQITSSTIQYMLSTNSYLGSQLSWGRNSFLFRWLLNEYGPVVRLQAPFGGNVIILSRPEDAYSVFASEGRYPVRSSLDCIEHYRLKYRNYKHVGPFLMSGENWESLRKHVSDSLNNSTNFQFKRTEIMCNEFVGHINKIKNKQSEVPPTFYTDISKWALESLCSVILGQKIMFKNPSMENSNNFIQAFHGATNAIMRCESGFHLWKFVETPAWKSLVKNCDIIDGIVSKCLVEAEDSLKSKCIEDNRLEKKNAKEIPLIESLLLHENMNTDEILTIFLDMILIGVNAVTHSAAFLFYHLARNPKAQRILIDEVKAAPQFLTVEDVSKMEYLKACIKESLRLKPPIPVLSRILTKDTVISNYCIPKGTTVLMATYLSSTREEHFDDAMKFIPERWLGLDTSNLECSVACIPFGYGPKVCVAKNLAEMQLSLLLIKVLRQFKIQYHYGDINSLTKLLAQPDKPLKFRFMDNA